MNYLLLIGLTIGCGAVVVLCLLGWQLLGQNGRILLRLDTLEKQLDKLEAGGQRSADDLPVNSPAPEFELPDLAGRSHTLAEFRGKPLLLVFFNPACGFCQKMAPQLVELYRSGPETVRDGAVAATSEKPAEFPDRPRLLLVSTGGAQANRELFGENGVGKEVLLQKEQEVAAAYKANGTPTGYLISSEGKIASELAIGADALLALVNGKSTGGSDKPESGESLAAKVEAGPASGAEQPATATTPVAEDRANRFSKRSLANSKLKRDGLKAGTAAPKFKLPRVDGKGEISLDEFAGRPVFLVFSSPHCGPCNTLAPKLEKFHREHPNLPLVMISQGEAAENVSKVKEHELTFPVVLQKQWEVSRDYAMFSTPVGYLIDNTGVIAADVAVGVDGVEGLMTRAEGLLRQDEKPAEASVLKRASGWSLKVVGWVLQKFNMGLGMAGGKLRLFELKHFKFVPRPDDVFVVTYPRSGTTWLQMILYQLTTDGNMDFPHIAQHCPWFERSMHSGCGFENRSSPRIFKSHLPYRQIPKGPGRYIYVVRDGRDVAVSYYNLYRNYNQYEGTFEDFFKLFIRGKVHYGSWFEHVEAWRKHRHDLNVLFLSYEELSRDLEGCIRRIIAFCHFDVAPEKLPRILERCSFAFMKQHEAKFDPALEMLWEGGTQLNGFLRVGRAGEGVRELSKAQRTRFEQVLGGHEELTNMEPLSNPNYSSV
jgi:peroxiredoxin